MTDKETGDRSEWPKAPQAEGPIIYSSDDIFQGRNEVWIEHGENMYRLRLTAAGRLYLTK
jgi:hemin uptake protein HemP